MSKCGKGCMPECEYFTTGGCISPFNCPYKIETGYINSATSTTDSLTGLLMEFDEMGLLRQYRALDPEKYAIEGREKVRKEIERLKSENADLKKRLDNAIELPCVGDKVYWIETWCAEPRIDEYTVHGFMIDTTNQKVSIRVKLDENGFFVPLVGEYKGKQLFFNRAKAEARLAELKGGRE